MVQEKSWGALHLPQPTLAELSHAKRISDLMQTEQGRTWWLENGISHNMIFNLQANSYSIKIFKQYLEYKRSKDE